MKRLGHILSVAALGLFVAMQVGAAIQDYYKINPYTGKLDNVGTFQYYTSQLTRFRLYTSTHGGGMQNLSSYYRKQAHSQYSANRQAEINGKANLTGAVFTGTVQIARQVLTTPTDGLILTPAVASTADVPIRYSPRTKWTSSAWNTGTAAHNSNSWTMENIPTSGNPPTSTLRIGWELHGGGFSYPYQFGSNGTSNFLNMTTNTLKAANIPLLTAHNLDTVQAHGGILPMIASHAALTTDAHGGIVSQNRFNTYSASRQTEINSKVTTLSDAALKSVGSSHSTGTYFDLNYGGVSFDDAPNHLTTRYNRVKLDTDDVDYYLKGTVGQIPLNSVITTPTTFKNYTSTANAALVAHNLDTVQAHGGILPMVASHAALTTSAHGGIVAASTWQSYTSARKYSGETTKFVRADGTFQTLQATTSGSGLATNSRVGFANTSTVGFSADSKTVYVDSTNHRVGFGTKTPLASSHFLSNINPVLYIDKYGNDANPSLILLRKNRGASEGLNTALLQGDILGGLSVRGSYSGGFGATDAGSIVFGASQAWTSGARGTRADFYTTRNGAVDATLAMRISQDGNVGIGSGPVWGTSATQTLSLGTGVAPSTSPADVIQAYSADTNGVAGEAGLHVRTESGVIHKLGTFFQTVTAIATTTINYVAKLTNNVKTKLATAYIAFTAQDSTGTEYVGASVGTIFGNSSAARKKTAIVFNNMTGGNLRTAMVITGQNIGIGTSAPTGTLHVVDEVSTVTRGINIQQNNNGNQITQLQFVKGRGTYSAPAKVIEADGIGGFNASGYDGAAYQVPASVQFKVMSSVTVGGVKSGSVPTGVIVLAGTSASAGKRPERLRITPDGRVGINTTTPRAGFDNYSNSMNSGRTYTGSATNYGVFDAALGLRYAGNTTTWDDLRVEPTVRGAASATTPAFDITNFFGGTIGVYNFDDSPSEKEIYFTAQMPHTWKGGTSPISIHVHWVARVSDTTAAPRWGLTYSWTNIGQTFPANLTVYTDGINYMGGTTSPNVTANTHYISEFAALTPSATQGGFSTILVGKLFRNSTNALDTYNAANADCGLLYVDIHYEVDSTGSDEEYGKTPTP